MAACHLFELAAFSRASRGHRRESSRAADSAPPHSDLYHHESLDDEVASEQTASRCGDLRHPPPKELAASAVKSPTKTARRRIHQALGLGQQLIAPVQRCTAVSGAGRRAVRRPPISIPKRLSRPARPAEAKSRERELLPNRWPAECQSRRDRFSNRGEVFHRPARKSEYSALVVAMKSCTAL